MPHPRAVGLSGDQAKTAWFALQAYKDKLEHDLKTRYDGHPGFSDEDRVFLNVTIQEVTGVINYLSANGITY